MRRRFLAGCVLVVVVGLVYYNYRAWAGEGPRPRAPEPLPDIIGEARGGDEPGFPDWLRSSGGPELEPAAPWPSTLRDPFKTRREQDEGTRYFPVAPEPEVAEEGDAEPEEEPEERPERPPIEVRWVSFFPERGSSAGITFPSEESGRVDRTVRAGDVLGVEGRPVRIDAILTDPSRIIVSAGGEGFEILLEPRGQEGNAR